MPSGVPALLTPPPPRAPQGLLALSSSHRAVLSLASPTLSGQGGQRGRQSGAPRAPLPLPTLLPGVPGPLPLPTRGSHRPPTTRSSHRAHTTSGSDRPHTTRGSHRPHTRLHPTGTRMPLLPRLRPAHQATTMTPSLAISVRWVGGGRGGGGAPR